MQKEFRHRQIGVSLNDFEFDFLREKSYEKNLSKSGYLRNLLIKEIAKNKRKKAEK